MEDYFMKMSEILSHIEYVVKGNKVPILKGGTGIGKSATVRQLIVTGKQSSI